MLGHVKTPYNPGGAVNFWPGVLQIITNDPTITYINFPEAAQTEI